MNLNINRVKIVVTIPEGYIEKVRDAVCNAGAGTLSDSNYTFCTTVVKSLGTFIPNSNANPFIGESNKLEVVKEDRLEVICEVDKVKQVLSELKRVHPYEEPAIDIIPLLDGSMFIKE